MVRSAILVVLLCLSGAVFGQSSATLGDAHVVDIRPSWVQWNPAGDCLAYGKDTDTGVTIGLYQLGEPQGSQLLQLRKTDVWKLDWFENLDAAIVTVTSSDKSAKHLAVYVLEAKPGSATKVFEDSGPASDNLSIDAILSPLLEHAVFELHEGAINHHYILPTGGSSLILAPDLDEAAKEGMVGPKWAASGTAFYMHGDPAVTFVGSDPTSGGTVIQLGGDNGNLQVKGVTMQLEISYTNLLAELMSAPAAGEVGLELMPDRGILRQVKSPGPYEAPKREPYPIKTGLQRADVTVGRMAGKSQSLWLISKDKSWWTLVAPSAQDSWLSPTGQSIAYTVDGALFVRSFGG